MFSAGEKFVTLRTERKKKRCHQEREWRILKVRISLNNIDLEPVAIFFYKILPGYIKGR